MQRLLLATCLALLAGVAAAKDPVPAETASPACGKAAAEAAEKPNAPAGDEATSTPGATAPVRPRSGSSGRVTPRWNSLLPGMIR